MQHYTTAFNKFCKSSKLLQNTPNLRADLIATLCYGFQQLGKNSHSMGIEQPETAPNQKVFGFLNRNHSIFGESKSSKKFHSRHFQTEPIQKCPENQTWISVVNSHLFLARSQPSQTNPTVPKVSRLYLENDWTTRQQRVRVDLESQVLGS